MQTDLAEEVQNIIEDLVINDPVKYLPPVRFPFAATMNRYLDDDLLYEDAWIEAQRKGLASTEDAFGKIFDAIYGKVSSRLQSNARQWLQDVCRYYGNGECEGCISVGMCLLDN